MVLRDSNSKLVSYLTAISTAKRIVEYSTKYISVYEIESTNNVLKNDFWEEVGSPQQDFSQ